MNASRYTKHTFASLVAVGIFAACSSTPTSEDTGETTAEALSKPASVEACAINYFAHLGEDFKKPKVIVRPSIHRPIDYTNASGTGIALWGATLSFSNQPDQEFTVDDDEVGHDCRKGTAAHRPRNPPGGKKVPKHECTGCFWSDVHTDHPHHPCPGAHQHEYCLNWSEEDQTCYVNPTRNARCVDDEASCPSREHACGTVCCPEGVNCNTCLGG